MQLKIECIEKKIEQTDKNGNINLILINRFNYDKNGKLIRFECYSPECGFYNHLKNNFSIYEYNYNDSGQLTSIKDKNALNDYFAEIQYQSNKKVETWFNIDNSKSHKNPFLVTETTFDSIGRDYQLKETSIYSKQVTMTTFLYNINNDIVTRIVNSQSSTDTTNYEYEYDTKKHQVNKYQTINKLEKELIRTIIYDENGVPVKEIEFETDLPSFNYRFSYNHWK